MTGRMPRLQMVSHGVGLLWRERERSYVAIHMAMRAVSTEYEFIFASSIVAIDCSGGFGGEVVEEEPEDFPFL